MNTSKQKHLNFNTFLITNNQNDSKLYRLIQIMNYSFTHVFNVFNYILLKYCASFRTRTMGFFFHACFSF